MLWPRGLSISSPGVWECWRGIRSCLCPLSLSFKLSKLCELKHLFSLLIRAFGLWMCSKHFQLETAVILHHVHFTDFIIWFLCMEYLCSMMSFKNCLRSEEIITTVNWKSESHWPCIDLKIQHIEGKDLGPDRSFLVSSLTNRVWAGFGCSSLNNQIQTAINRDLWKCCLHRKHWDKVLLFVLRIVVNSEQWLVNGSSLD